MSARERAERHFVRREFARAASALREAIEDITEPAEPAALNAAALALAQQSQSHSSAQPQPQSQSQSQSQSQPLRSRSSAVMGRAEFPQDALDPLQGRVHRCSDFVVDASDDDLNINAESAKESAVCPCVPLVSLWLQIVGEISVLRLRDVSRLQLFYLPGEARTGGSRSFVSPAASSSSSSTSASSASSSSSSSSSSSTAASLPSLALMPVSVIRVAAAKMTLQEEFHDAETLLAHVFAASDAGLLELKGREAEGLLQLYCLYVLPALGRFSDALAVLDFSDDENNDQKKQPRQLSKSIRGNVVARALSSETRQAFRQRVTEVRRMTLSRSSSSSMTSRGAGGGMRGARDDRGGAGPGTPVSAQIMAAARSGYAHVTGAARAAGALRRPEAPVLSADASLFKGEGAAERPQQSSTGETADLRRPSDLAGRNARYGDSGRAPLLHLFLLLVKNRVEGALQWIKSDSVGPLGLALLVGIFVGLVSLRRNQNRRQLVASGDPASFQRRRGSRAIVRRQGGQSRGTTLWQFIRAFLPGFR